MADPTPTRAEVERYSPVDIHERNADMLAEPDGQWVRLCDYQALRERAEAAEAEEDLLRNAYLEGQCSHGETLIEMEDLREELAAARRAEVAAWNDAIEAAAQKCRENSMSSMAGEKAIRALRRAAPTEGEA